MSNEYKHPRAGNQVAHVKGAGTILTENEYVTWGEPNSLDNHEITLRLIYVDDEASYQRMADLLAGYARELQKLANIMEGGQ